MPHDSKAPLNNYVNIDNIIHNLERVCDVNKSVPCINISMTLTSFFSNVTITDFELY